MNEFIQDEAKSKNLVRKLAMHLKDSIGCDAVTRTRNHKFFTILQASGVINFPTEPIKMGYLDFIDEAIGLLERGGQAFNMVILFMGESQKIALQMSEVEVGKRLTTYSFKKIKTDPKSENASKGEKPTGKGTKRSLGGKPIPSGGKQSSTDTTTTQVEAPVDCYKCGGQHPAEIVRKWGAKYVCPFEHHNHPHVDNESVPFLDSTMGKPYKDHPWDQKDPTSEKMIPQYRLKMKRMLVNGTYVDTPSQELAPSRASAHEKKGETDPKGFLSQITNHNDNPFNPFMTLTVPTLRPQRRQGRKGAEERSVSEIKVSTALIDTGALDSDYISSRLANSISKLGYCVDTSKVDSVHTPFTNMPSIQCVGHMSSKVKIFNEEEINCEVLPNGFAIIGLRSRGANNRARSCDLRR